MPAMGFQVLPEVLEPNTFGSKKARQLIVGLAAPSRLNRFAVSPLGSCQINCLQQVMPPARNQERIQFMKEFYAGLELASSFFVICVTNSTGKIVASKKGLSTVAEVTRAMAEIRHKCPGHISLNIESGELATWGHGMVTPYVDRIVITDPRRNAWIARDPKKSDEVDAFKLAEILRSGNFTMVYIDESEDRRAFKIVVNRYEAWAQARAREMVLIKAFLRGLGIIRKDSRFTTHRSERPFSTRFRTNIFAKPFASSIAVLIQLLNSNAKLSRR